MALVVLQSILREGIMVNTRKEEKREERDSLEVECRVLTVFQDNPKPVPIGLSYEELLKLREHLRLGMGYDRTCGSPQLRRGRCRFGVLYLCTFENSREYYQANYTNWLRGKAFPSKWEAFYNYYRIFARAWREQREYLFKRMRNAQILIFAGFGGCQHA